jgi:hypothetical protein
LLAQVVVPDTNTEVAVVLGGIYQALGCLLPQVVRTQSLLALAARAVLAVMALVQKALMAPLQVLFQ